MAYKVQFLAYDINSKFCLIPGGGGGGGGSGTKCRTSRRLSVLLDIFH